MSNLATQIKESGIKMSNLATQIKESGNLSIRSNNSPSSGNKISPALLLIIVILAIIFFVAGILLFLIRFLMKRPSLSYNFSSNTRNQENNSTNNNTNSEALQRQLQQLFRLHDSGLDQALIDALPVFYYKDIMGLKEPFDCAVCLCEFCDQDKLRLLPLCSHAFHISCIDTWLLSNSTCPLCRGSLLGCGLENQEFSLEYWRELSFGRSIDYETSFRIGSFNKNHGCNNSNSKPSIMEESASERRVFSVRLGKFRSLNDRGECTSKSLNDRGEGSKEFENGETSSGGDCGDVGGGNDSNQLDARRCYSLGSYQYVLADSNLQVALSTNVGDGDTKVEKMVGQNGNALNDGDVEGKKISRRNRGESFSVSKMWLWSKKGKFQGSSTPTSETNVHHVHVHVHGGPPPLNVVLPLSTRDHFP